MPERSERNRHHQVTNCKLVWQDRRATTSAPTTPVAQIRAQSAENLQRSILRQTGSVSKRRKVAFISPSIDMSEPCNTDSESSIELELEVCLVFSLLALKLQYLQEQELVSYPDIIYCILCAPLPCANSASLDSVKTQTKSTPVQDQSAGCTHPLKQAARHTPQSK